MCVQGAVKKGSRNQLENSMGENKNKSKEIYFVEVNLVEGFRVSLKCKIDFCSSLESFLVLQSPFPNDGWQVIESAMN